MRRKYFGRISIILLIIFSVSAYCGHVPHTIGEPPVPPSPVVVEPVSVAPVGDDLSALARERAAAVDAERRYALSLRADVAMRNEFNAADAVFNRANAAFDGANYQEAITLNNQSESMFRAVSEAVLRSRRLAEEALARAGERMEESDETARNVESILRGATP
jgi:hypothetical protein